MSWSVAHRPSEGRIRIYDLRRWLERNDRDLLQANVGTDLGWGPSLDRRPRAAWISFETQYLRGRATLWSSGSCELSIARRDDGTLLLADEVIVSSSHDLERALGILDELVDNRARYAPQPWAVQTVLQRRACTSPGDELRGSGAEELVSRTTGLDLVSARLAFTVARSLCMTLRIAKVGLAVHRHLSLPYSQRPASAR